MIKRVVETNKRNTNIRIVKNQLSPRCNRFSKICLISCALFDPIMSESFEIMLVPNSLRFKNVPNICRITTKIAGMANVPKKAVAAAIRKGSLFIKFIAASFSVRPVLFKFICLSSSIK